MKKLAFLCGLVLPFLTHAQQTATNFGNLQIHSGGNLSFAGNLVNNSTANFVNAGTVYAKGNLTNHQSSITANAGTFYLNGTSAQAIGGTQPWKVYNLVTDNASGINLSTDLSVSGVHSFTAGNINGSTAYTIYESGASYAGAADTRHVNGPVRRTGNSNFIFPVGSASYLRPIQLSSLSLSSTFDVSYATATPNSTSLLAPLVSIDFNEYWKVNRVAGGTAVVGLNWDNSKVSFPTWNLTEIQAVAWNGTQWAATGGAIATGNATTSGSVGTGTMNAFSLFGIGSNSYPLPLILLNFRGSREEGFSRLSWRTTNETGVGHFNLERSSDGQHFTSVTTVRALNTYREEAYSYDDYLPLNGVVYYRLRSVDLDGREKVSQIVKLTDAETKPSLVLARNPVRERLDLVPSHIAEGEYQYTIRSAAGQLIQSGKTLLRNGQINPISFSASVIKGNYYLTVFNATSTYSMHFLH